jgi:ubiquinone/menaquinone biosynthesis C-methylase UbiE
MTEACVLFADGEHYERVMGRWSRLVGESFLDWIAIPPGMRWADVGCGNGAFTEIILARCAPSSVRAFDPAPGQIAYARKQPSALQADYQIANAEALPLSNDSVDAAVMALVISFIADPAKAVAELVRVTQPGGTVAAYMWDLEGEGVPTRHIFRAASSLGITPQGPPTPAASQQDAMRELWQAAGLQAIETTTIAIPIRHASFDAYWAAHSLPAGPAGRLIQTLPPEGREQLQSRLREILPTADDGSVAFESIANAVKGRVPA